MDAAGLDGLTFHSSRHSAAAFAIHAGTNVIALSRWLGHSKPSINLDVYGHVFDASGAEIAAGLDRLWEQAL